MSPRESFMLFCANSANNATAYSEMVNRTTRTIRSELASDREVARDPLRSRANGRRTAH